MTDAAPDFVATAARAREMLSGEACERIAAYLADSQTDAGGFCDRAGRPDLYYTVFGLAGRIALGCAIPRVETVRSFLDERHNLDALSFVELVSLMRCRRFLEETDRSSPIATEQKERLIEALNRYRSRDGGYSHETRDANQGTLYAAFLAEQALRDLGSAREGKRHLMVLMDALKTPDGGYSNHRGASHGVVTVTASAMALLVGHEKCHAARMSLGFLDSLCCPDGGYRATPATPTPDLLSTATALYARSLCERPARGRVKPVMAAFVEQLWSDTGGFRGHALDPAPDVEYTFYALLALGAVGVLNDQ